MQMQSSHERNREKEHGSNLWYNLYYTEMNNDAKTAKISVI